MEIYILLIRIIYRLASFLKVKYKMAFFIKIQNISYLSYYII